MKKLIAISILLTVLSAAAFAETEDAGGKLLPGFHVRLEGKFQPDLLLVTSPTGDAANVEKNYEGNGTFDFLTTYGTWQVNDLDVWITYGDPDGKFAARVQLNAEKWINNLAASTYDSDQSLLSFLNIPFGDWDLWGKVGIFRGFAGNTAQRGVVARYHDTADVFVDKFKIDNYGIINPFGAHLDMNNLRRNISTASADNAKQGGNAYLSLQADVSPIIVDVATELGTFFPEATALATDSYSAASGAFRVSGKGIANLVDFDVIYKLRSFDPSTDTKVDTPEQPDGKGITEHAFGLYANLNLIDGLGIGIGYSGSVRAQENETTGTEDLRYLYPYFNGIDLRFKLSMIDKLTVTFNNNVSFSSIQNDDDILTTVYGVKQEVLPTPGTRDKEFTSSYLALYNHLALKYAITDALSANVSIGNKLNSYNTTNDQDETKQIVHDEATDTFIGTAYADYGFTRNVKMQAGLAIQIVGNSWKETDQTAADWGSFTFGIPIRFAIRF